MSIHFHLQSRYVLDTSSAMLYTHRLKYFVHWYELARKENPHFGKEDRSISPHDKPFIMLPPCWWELREGVKSLEGVHERWLEKITEALKVLEKVVEAGLMNGEEEEESGILATSETPVEERKMFWLKKVKNELKGQKNLIFFTENPFLLIRAGIARINACSLWALFNGEIPKEPWSSWSFEGRESNENVIIVDERFFTTNEGARLMSKLPVYHGLYDLTFRIFLTSGVQEFVQSNQQNQSSELDYPFIFCDPRKAYFDWYPESRKPEACSLPKTHRLYVDHEAENMSLLADSVRFQQERGHRCIGEPYGVATVDGTICLDQVPPSSNIFIVSDDQEWSIETRDKVLNCGRDSEPKLLTMAEAFKEFDWTGKPTMHDEFIGSPDEDDDTESEEGDSSDQSADENPPKKVKLGVDEMVEGTMDQLG